MKNFRLPKTKRDRIHVVQAAITSMTGNPSVRNRFYTASRSPDRSLQRPQFHLIQERSIKCDGTWYTTEFSATRVLVGSAYGALAGRGTQPHIIAGVERGLGDKNEAAGIEVPA